MIAAPERKTASPNCLEKENRTAVDSTHLFEFVPPLHRRFNRSTWDTPCSKERASIPRNLFALDRMKSARSAAVDRAVEIPLKTTEMALCAFAFIDTVQSPSDGTERRVTCLVAVQACSKICTTKSPREVLRASSTRRPCTGEGVHLSMFWRAESRRVANSTVEIGHRRTSGSDGWKSSVRGDSHSEAEGVD